MGGLAGFCGRLRLLWLVYMITSLDLGFSLRCVVGFYDDAVCDFVCVGLDLWVVGFSGFGLIC